MDTMLTHVGDFYRNKSDDEKEESVKTNLDFLNRYHGVVTPEVAMNFSPKEQNQYISVSQLILGVFFTLPEDRAIRYRDYAVQIIENVIIILSRQQGDHTEMLANMPGLTHEIRKHENKLRRLQADGNTEFNGKYIDMRLSDKEEVLAVVTALLKYTEKLKFLGGEKFDSTIYQPLIPELGFLGVDEKMPEFSFDGPTQKILWMEWVGVIDAVAKKCSTPNLADPGNPTINYSKTANILHTITGVDNGTLKAAIIAIFNKRKKEAAGEDPYVKNHPMNSEENKEFLKKMMVNFKL